MNASNIRPAFPAMILALGLGIGLASIVPGSARAAWPNLPSTPIAVQAQPDPNIILTLDDSGSMTWAFVPDNPKVVIDGVTYNNTCPNGWGVGTGGTAWDHATTPFTCKRVLAARFNPLAYNPFVVYDPPYNPNLTGAKLGSSFTSAPINGFNSASVTVNLSANYRPMVTYSPAYNAITESNNKLKYLRLSPSEAAYFYAYYNDLGAGDVPPEPGTDPGTFVRQTTPPVGTCAGLEEAVRKFNDACYKKIVVPASHQQNFANWYSFYRNRNLMTNSAANIAFYDLNPNYRLTFQSLSTSYCGNGFNRNDCKGWDLIGQKNFLRPLSDATHRSAFYAWLARLPADGSTPLRTGLQRAGKFISTAGVNSPRAFDPGTSETPVSTCRANFSVLMTDGIWNTGSEVDFDSLGNVDKTDKTLSDGTKYEPAKPEARPFPDDNTDSLADLAFYYWANDLQTDVANDMIPYYMPGSSDYWDAHNDPATWQHMVTFTVGLGLGGSLTGAEAGDGSGYLPLWGTNMWDGDYPKLKDGKKAWPLTGGDKQGNVADLWHAAVNSRGMFFNADSPQSIQRAFAAILNRIKASETSLGQIGASSSRVTGDTVSVDSKFVPGDWYSIITAYKVYEDGSRGDVIWKTDTTFTSESGRNIFTSVAGSGLAFDGSFFPVHGSSKMGTTDINVFNWLRGERSKEGTVSGAITLRKRKQLLGDIVGSDIIVSGKNDEGYQFLTDIGSTEYGSARDAYQAYVNSKKPVIFAGANDGMLHAFNESGTEVFAYIPNAMLSRLRRLAADDYVHEYFVDGALALHDVYLGTGWRTILVGGYGGGGRGWYALDVTSVVTGGSFSASDVLFDLAYDGSDAVRKELGYSFGTPVVGRTFKDKWVVLMPNGYGDNSAPYGNNSCRAQLIIYDLTAKTLSAVDTGSGNCSAGNQNGLSSPAGLEFAAGAMIGAYAGDLKGNVWRFSMNSSGAWTTPTLFFTAKTSTGVTQPITGAPAMRRHPGGGVMVVVGTGKFFESTDRTNKQVQTVYGLRDTGVSISGRDKLVEQKITAGTNMSDVFRVISNYAVDWTTKRGWFMDFATEIAPSVASGERIIAAPAINGDLALFNTYSPGANACTGAGGGFLMAFNFFTGGLPPKVALFDTNNDGKIDATDLVESGGQVKAGVKLSSQSLKSPSTMLVTTPTRGGKPDATATCGGVGQAPCLAPNPACQQNLVVRGGVCVELKCSPGYIQVSSGGMPTCMLSESARYPRWIELN